MKKRKRILSLFVTFCTFFALLAVPRSAAMSAEPDDAVGVLSLPDIITEAEAAENGYVARVSAAETNLNTLVFRNADGTNTMRIFDHPVKFEDGGTVKDITLGIKASRGGFVSAQSPIRTVFPSRLSDGISLTYDGIEIEMIPEAASRTGTAAVLSGDGKKVTYAYGNRTALEYTLTYTGFKEDIVVEEYTGQTDFDFTLRTNGLILVSENGSYYLRDAAGKTKAALGDIIIFTADERNNAFGSMTHKTVTAGQEYVITVHVDDEYLKDEKTAYPIRIDPTIEIVYDGTNASAIEDVTLNSLGSSAPNSGSIYVGKRGNYGISRTLMRFPGLDLSQIGTSDQIISARVELRDLMCYSTHLPISCHIFQSNWHINTVNWSNASPNNYVSTAMDTKTVYYGNGDSTICGTQRYSFYITKAVKRWKDSQYTHPCGIIFKTTNEIETGNTNVSVCFASYNRASNKPSFTMVYSNPYAANYLDYRKYDNSTISNTNVSDLNRLLQKRANCYGFALRFTYTGNYVPAFFLEQGRSGYLQQPGEFAIKYMSSTNYPSNYDKLGHLYLQSIVASNGYSASFIMRMVENDMSWLGFHVTYPETQYTSSSQISTGVYENKRLVLLVIGQRDYHFYLQNSNGTWSHKPGTDEATNQCFGHCGTATNLTNSNILNHCQEGGYTREYKFFFVDKPSTIDYCHGDGTAPTCEILTPVQLVDVAGDEINSSKGIVLSENGSATINGMIDYNYDIDCFSFDVPLTKTYSVNISTLKNGLSYSHSIGVSIIMQNGQTPLYSNANVSGETMVNVNLQAGKIYYISVYVRNDAFDHWRQYRINIS